MAQASLSHVLQLRQKIQREKEKYLKAIEAGKEHAEAKEIVRTLTALQMELEKLMPRKKDGYQGF